MNNIHEVLGIIAGVFSILGYLPYIISILRGKTRPNQATWFIWTIVGGLLAFSYLAEGDSKTIWLPLGYFLGPLITAILSLRYGYSTWSKLDGVCMIAALVSIIPWILSKNATFTLLINVLIDATGGLPTVVKSYREPETEDLTAWLIFFIANTIQLFAITEWNIAATYPIYLFILVALILIPLVKNKIKRKASLPSEP